MPLIRLWFLCAAGLVSACAPQPQAVTFPTPPEPLMRPPVTQDGICRATAEQLAALQEWVLFMGQEPGNAWVEK